MLRRLTPADLPAFQAYRHDAHVGLYQGWEPQSDLDASQFLADMSAVVVCENSASWPMRLHDSRT